MLSWRAAMTQVYGITRTAALEFPLQLSFSVVDGQPRVVVVVTDIFQAMLFERLEEEVCTHAIRRCCLVTQAVVFLSPAVSCFSVCGRGAVLGGVVVQEVWARLGLSMTQTFTWQFTRRVAEDGTVGTDVALTPLSRTLTLSSIGQ